MCSLLRFRVLGDGPVPLDKKQHSQGSRMSEASSFREGTSDSALSTVTADDGGDDFILRTLPSIKVQNCTNLKKLQKKLHLPADATSPQEVELQLVARELRENIKEAQRELGDAEEGIFLDCVHEIADEARTLTRSSPRSSPVKSGSPGGEEALSDTVFSRLNTLEREREYRGLSARRLELRETYVGELSCEDDLEKLPKLADELVGDDEDALLLVVPN